MKRRYLEYFFGFLLMIALVIWAAYFSQTGRESSKDLEVYFLDVGQGDSEYIKLPSGQDILIDGGPDDKVLAALGEVMNTGDHEINLVELTHPHADHVTGLVDVLARYKVDEIWESGVDYPSAAYDSWKAEIKAKNIPDRFVMAGASKNFGLENFKVLYPLRSEKNQKVDDVNNASVITELDDNKVSFLFLGDAQKQAEQEVLPSLHLITVMKIGHHGSSNGTLEDMLKVTRPAVGVIEVGKNNTYGHPAPSTISLLKQYAVQIYRTDQDGIVEVSTDGNTYAVKTN